MCTYVYECVCVCDALRAKVVKLEHTSYGSCNIKLVKWCN